MYEKAYVISGARTPIGRCGGRFKDIPSYDLGAAASVEAMKRARLTYADVDEVAMGCIAKLAADAHYTRTEAALTGDTPRTVLDGTAVILSDPSDRVPLSLGAERPGPELGISRSRQNEYAMESL